MSGLAQTIKKQQGVASTIPIPATFDGNMIHVPAAATAAVVALTAVADKPNIIEGVDWSYSAAPTGGALTISDGTTTFLHLKGLIAGAGSWRPPKPLASAINKTLTVTLASGGGAVEGTLIVHGFVEP